MRNSLLRHIGIKIGGVIWYAFSLIIPKNPLYIAINSFPDFDDTIRSFAKATSFTQLRLIVLTIEKNVVVPSWLNIGNVTVVYRYSAKGIWLYHRSSFVFFTHGLFSFWFTSPKQTIVNLWHGMPLKRIGLLDDKRPSQIPRFDLTIANDEKFRAIMSRAFGVTHERVLISLHPRVDMLANAGRSTSLALPLHRILSVWLPTYRTSKVGDLRVDGKPEDDIFNPAHDFSAIDELFRHYDCLCLVKPHPMDRVDRNLFDQYKNLLFIDEECLHKAGSTLYELLGDTSFLIADVSSVYFDYKLTKRPIVLFCPDLDAYEKSRGFVSSIGDLVCQKIITEKDTLITELREVLEKTPNSQHVTVSSVTTELLKSLGVLDPHRDVG